MILNEYFYKFLYFKNKTLYLILLLPISLFIGSTITNIFIILIIILFILECVQKKYYFFLEKDFYILFAFFIYIILLQLVRTDDTGHLQVTITRISKRTSDQKNTTAWTCHAQTESTV